MANTSDKAEEEIPGGAEKAEDVVHDVREKVKGASR